VYVFIDTIRHRVGRNRIVLWVLGSAIFYFCVFPLYVFLLQGIRKRVAIPASLLLFAVMIAVLVFPFSASDGNQKAARASQENGTASALSERRAAAGAVSADSNGNDTNASVADLERQLNIKFSKLSKSKIKGIYLGMGKSEAMSVMKTLLGESGGYDITTDQDMMFFGDPSNRMTFWGDALVGYTYNGMLVDKLFNAGVLGLKAFAQQFCNSYGLENMIVESDEQGNEYLIHRNNAGFSVKIHGDKSIEVGVLKNAGTPSFN
jgi:hypothetical protein